MCPKDAPHGTPQAFCIMHPKDMHHVALCAIHHSAAFRGSSLPGPGRARRPFPHPPCLTHAPPMPSPAPRARQGKVAHGGRSLKVERLARDSPVDSSETISRPKHRNRLYGGAKPCSPSVSKNKLGETLGAQRTVRSKLVRCVIGSSHREEP